MFLPKKRRGGKRSGCGLTPAVLKVSVCLVEVDNENNGSAVSELCKSKDKKEMAVGSDAAIAYEKEEDEGQINSN